MINLKYALFWVLPLVSAGTWLGQYFLCKPRHDRGLTPHPGMLLAMFITWEVEGSPQYVSMESGQNIAYISDIGAQGLKPLFIAGCCVTTIFLDLSFAAERWLRHTGRLAKNMGTAEKVLSGLSIVFAIAGTCGLILLSIFDTVQHPRLHDGFLLLFIAGYVISAIFICAEYQRLGVHFRQHRILRASFWMKLFFIIIEIFLAAVFIGTSFSKGNKNVAAIFEWVIAIIFTFYVFTFFVDLLPASRDHQKDANLELGHVDGPANERHSHGYAATNGAHGFDGAADIAYSQRPKPPMAQNY
ncbi:MAG: hypothetical protein LQ346_004665 [Caloplaca aetnensis]|nr:MAG: hypothetical protein LQ346_004665 [Caloplaca aetnensis]